MKQALQVLKDWWWLAVTVGSALVLWGSLPDRMRKVEAEQSKQQTEVSELREWTKETQGFLKGQAALNERLAAQQAMTPIVSELSDDGEVKEMLWTDRDGRSHHECCEGYTCWTWQPKTKCQR